MRDRLFVILGTFILAALFLAPVTYGDIFLTVNGEDVDTILLPVGDLAYIDVHSDNFDSYIAYLYYGPTMGTFFHLDTFPEAGEYAYVEEGGEMFQIGADGIESPPTPGIHFIFQFDAPFEYEEFDVVLEDEFNTYVDSVHITVMSAPPDDVTPPEPNPMTWDSAPSAIGYNRITMTATTASDPSGVEYYFECVSGGGNDSDWQLDTTYVDMPLQPSTQYTYRVKARDMSELMNETGWSAPAQATTDRRSIYVDDDALADPGPGDPNISDPFEDGSEKHPFDAIQEAVDVTLYGDTVVVLDGTYTGTGNYDIDLSDKGIIVRSQNGPANCIIDGQYEGIIGFRFFEDSVEPKVEGFTIKNFHDIQEGGGIAILCESSSPMIKDCIIQNNWIGI
ncbi:MAG: hypothetical protein ACYS32_18395, partial [Planctomycetota bacterium]